MRALSVPPRRSPTRMRESAPCPHTQPMQCGAVPLSAARCGAVPCSAVSCRAVPCQNICRTAILRTKPLLLTPVNAVGVNQLVEHDHADDALQQHVRQRQLGWMVMQRVVAVMVVVMMVDIWQVGVVDMCVPIHNL